jgi:hypothetical protein
MPVSLLLAAVSPLDSLWSGSWAGEGSSTAKKAMKLFVSL